MRGALTRAALADYAATQPDASSGSAASVRRPSRRVMPLSFCISLAFALTRFEGGFYSRCGIFKRVRRFATRDVFHGFVKHDDLGAAIQATTRVHIVRRD